MPLSQALLDLAHVIARQAQPGPAFLIALSFSQRSEYGAEVLRVETNT